MSATSLVAQALVGSTNTVSVHFDVWGATNFTTHYSVIGGEAWGWTENRLGGMSTGQHETVTLTASPRDLAPGVHTGLFQVVADTANSPVDIAWRLTILRRSSTLAAVPITEARATTGSNSVVKTLSLMLEGELDVDYQITANQPWVHVGNPTGTVSGTGRDVEIRFDPAGLPQGTYTAALSVVSATYTTSYSTVFSVHPADVLPPVLSVSTNELAFAAPRYMKPANQTLYIRNAGGCGIGGTNALRYTISYLSQGANDWFKMHPLALGYEFENRGEVDAFQIDIYPGTLPPALFTREVMIRQVGGAGAEERVRVRFRIEDPLDYDVALTHEISVNSIEASPPPNPNGRYAHGTQLTLVAIPSLGYDPAWAGDLPTENDTLTVTITNNLALHAFGRRTTMMHGFVTDASSGNPVVGARVLLNGKSTSTLGGSASPGGYALSASSAAGAASVERDGYLRLIRQVSLVTGEWNRVDFAIQRELFGALSMTVPETTEAIIVDYTLKGEPDEVHPVDVDVSFDRGATWQTPPGYPTNFSGALGGTVHTGPRRIFWQTMQTYPFFHLTNVLLRLRSGDQTRVSSPFDINTQVALNPKFLIYHDHNRNKSYDSGEELPGAEVYLGGRTPAHLRGTTDDNGWFTWAGRALKTGDSVFARKHLHTRDAEKSGHGAVDNVMHILWLDTDIGTLNDADTNVWDGVWSSFTVTRNQIWNMQSGFRLPVPANHPLVEWNLTIDSSDDDPVILANLDRALVDASKYLYRITDGQMKFNKLYVRSDDHRLNEGDVWIRWRYTRASANVGGIFWNPSVVSDRRIKIGFADLQTSGIASNWGRTLVHEFGHYAMGMYDEYRSRIWEDAFIRYAYAHSNLYAQPFGFMDDQRSIDSMSSRNDYLANAVDYLPSGSENMMHETGRYWPEQFSHHGKDCWRFFEDRYQMTYHGRFVNFLIQRSGFYVNGTSSVPDRLSSFTIPGPYTTCLIRHNDEAYVPMATAVMAAAAPASVRWSSARGPVDLIVLRNGLPCGAAQVGRRRSGNIPFEFIGHTPRDGRMHVTSLAPGDQIVVNHLGLQAAHAVVAQDLGGNVTIDLGAAATRRATLGALAETPLAMLITGAFSANDYLLTLAPTFELAARPVVTVCENDTLTNAIPMSSIEGTPTRYQGRIPIAATTTELTVEISALSQGGQTFHTFDLATLIPVSTNDFVAQSLVSPSPELQARNTRGLIYQAFGPVPLPASATNRFIGPAIHFALADGSAVSPLAMAQLSLHYAPTLPAGVDERDLALCRWSSLPAGWVPVSRTHEVATRSVSAEFDSAGPYALFARESSDLIPPARIGNLFASLDPTDAGRVVLTWTATGDDGTEGTATAYELRFARAPFDDSSLDNATALALRLTPAASAAAEHYTLTLPPERLWYMALRVRDGAGNWSPLSNLASARPVRPSTPDSPFPSQFLSSLALRGFPAVDPDGDIDGDGLSNWEEYLRQTDPTQSDSDGDGMPDGFESRYGLDPLDLADGGLDPDGDGLTNLEECQLASDPRRPNTAGDGLDDGWKHRHGFDLLAETDTGADTDRDGVPTGAEYVADTDPNDAASYLRVHAIVPHPAGVALSFESSPDRSYTLEAIVGLSTGQWHTVIGPFPGEGGTLLPLPSTSAEEFYRIHVTLPSE